MSSRIPKTQLNLKVGMLPRSGVAVTKPDINPVDATTPRGGALRETHFHELEIAVAA
jgi:hypothetical protein